MSFNFVAVATILSDFGAQENKICHYSHLFLFFTHIYVGLQSLGLQRVRYDQAIEQQQCGTGGVDYFCLPPWWYSMKSVWTLQK